MLDASLRGGGPASGPHRDLAMRSQAGCLNAARARPTAPDAPEMQRGVRPCWCRQRWWKGRCVGKNPGAGGWSENIESFSPSSDMLLKDLVARPSGDEQQVGSAATSFSKSQRFRYGSQDAPLGSFTGARSRRRMRRRWAFVATELDHATETRLGPIPLDPRSGRVQSWSCGLLPRRGSDAKVIG